MATRTRLLVIGPTALREEVVRALPNCEIVRAEHPLAGVWRMGHETFDGVCLSLSNGRNSLRAIRSLRELRPNTRIVVTCPATDEPVGRNALNQGADEYVLEPLQRTDIERAFRISPPPRLTVTALSPAPSLHEIVGLSSVLKQLADGPQATLERLADLIRHTFGATGVTIQLDDLAATTGRVDEPVLEETIVHRDEPIGRVLLARKDRGTYAAAEASRLAEYAALVEVTIAQAREQSRWRNLAWTDDLSGLRNRRYFERSLAELVARADRDRLRLTIVLFDIDDFKTYNDRYGHDTGDHLIREVAQLLTRCSREQDVVARYGGDEFVVILWDAEKPRVPGSQHPTEPIALADRFRTAISAHEFHCLGKKGPGPVTISGGLACFPWDGKTPEQLIAAADDALLTAKRGGKNRIRLAGQSGQNNDRPAAGPHE